MLGFIRLLKKAIQNQGKPAKFWSKRARKIHLYLENLEERLNPAPVFSLRELVDSPTSLVILSPDVAGQVPEQELEGSRVVVLNPGADAIGQITGSLAGLGRVDTLRLISHGSAGGLDLAGQWFDANALGARSEEISAWGNYLSRTPTSCCTAARWPARWTGSVWPMSWPG